MRFLWVIPLILGLGPARALADHSLESQTSVGSADFAEGISYEGNQEGQKDGKGWNWNLGYTYSHLTQPATSSSPEITDSSSEFAGGFGYERSWEAGLGLEYSTTPAEKLYEVGPNLYLGYTFQLGPKKEVKGKRKPKSQVRPVPKAAAEPSDDEGDATGEEEENEPFRPSISIKGTGSVLTYIENYNAAMASPNKRRSATRTQSESINQSSGELEVTASPWEWLSLTASYTQYHYNKNVNAFLAALDLPRAIRFGASNFASTLAGFPNRVIEGGPTFNFLDTWSLDATYTYTVNQSDSTIGRGIKSELRHEIGESWKVGVGAQHDSAPDTGVENFALMDLAYQF